MAEPEVFAVPSASAEPEPAPSVSMIVPIFEEEATVDELYRRTVAALEQDGRSFEILFVDDGSRDGTFARLEQPARRRPARARRPLQAQLRPAPGDARRPRARARRDPRHDGRRPPERARGHPEARRGGRGGRGRRERPPPDPARLVGPNAAEPDDQRDAPALHRRRHLGLRLRVQRVPPRRRRADARRDRQAEVHEGAHPLRRRERRRGRRRPRAAAGPVALLAASPDAARAARPRGLLAAADPVDRRRARPRLQPRSRSRSASTASGGGSTAATSRARSSAASPCSSCSGSKASSSRSSGST